MKKYKTIEVNHNHNNAEELMNEMAEKGWEVVCMTADPLSAIMAADPHNMMPFSELKLIITFCRDDSID